MDYAAEADTLTLELSWLPFIDRTEGPRAECFAPVEAELGLPSVPPDCGGALACGRLGGLSSIARFTELARGPYADLANVSRVMRQAGDRGQILLLVSAWPRLLGNRGCGRNERSWPGWLGPVRARQPQRRPRLRARDLDEDARQGQGLAYLRVDPAVLDALGPAAIITGLRLETISLAGADWAERGRFEDFAVYLVDAAAPDTGAWIVVADDCSGRCTSAADARVRDLLATKREAPGTLDPPRGVSRSGRLERSRATKSSLMAMIRRYGLARSTRPSVRAALHADGTGDHGHPRAKRAIAQRRFFSSARVIGSRHSGYRQSVPPP